MVPKPKDFQMSEKIIVQGKISSSPRKKTGWRPTDLSPWFTIPSEGERISTRIPAIMIHERKCGR